MRKLASLTFIATLPLAAGFALSAYAQDDMSTVPYGAPVMPVVSAPVPGNGADMSTRLFAMEQQLRDLTNQVEQKDFQLRQMQQSLDAANARILYLESQGAGTGGAGPQAPLNTFDTPASDAPPPSAMGVPPQPQPPAASQQQTGAVPGTLSDPNAPYQPSVTPALGQINESAPVTPNAGGAITSGRGQPAMGNAAQAYDQAFGYLQQSNYADAENAFRNFLSIYPSHPLAANAQYWLGETYFAQTQYSIAAKTFAKAFQDYPKGQKAPDALLKLALTLEKMDKKNDACLTLKELKKRFPAGPGSVLRRGDEEAVRMACPA